MHKFALMIICLVCFGLLVACPSPTSPAAVTATTPAQTISLRLIPGLVAPVNQATPVTTAINSAQYTGTISWSPTVSSTFAANTVYTATIVLTAKTGWTLDGVGLNSFTVTGATDTTNAANTGTVTAVFPATVYAIGDTGPAGGLICYISAGGFTENGVTFHYLEAAQSDQSTNLQWYNGSYITILGAQETAIGTGAANTAAIIAAQGAGSYAATACTAYRGGGKTDWFLPSKDELNAMYTNLKSSTLGGLASSYYWSSSQYNDNHTWYQNFGYYGHQDNYDGTYNGYYVRAVRAFNN